MSTYRQGVKGWKLHCGESIMQLFNGQRANSFIFVTRPPLQSGAEIITSIALQNISRSVQQVRDVGLLVLTSLMRQIQQMGRILRTPVTAIEIHVVSNRDRIAHQLFDLRFQRLVRG